MHNSEVRCAKTEEQRSAVSIIVSAFVNDPAARWVYPDPHVFLTQFPVFLRGFADRAFESGTAHITETARAAAFWLPPGVGPDEEALGAAIEALPESIGQDVSRVVEQMGSYHPVEPHWYLAFIGVDPPLQGQRLGSALLAYALERVDREHAPAYLEASNSKNVPIYERFGFKVTGTIQAGSSPVIYPMLRQAR